MSLLMKRDSLLEYEKKIGEYVTKIIWSEAKFSLSFSLYRIIIFSKVALCCPADALSRFIFFLYLLKIAKK